ncbi:MAG: hypothetical protein LIR50_12870 [Bacillota bacterium]|nr:hypothetical protein [Bacillota bacterium]
MKFIYVFYIILLAIPFIGIMLYTIFNPRESALFGKRWQFKNENLEPSEDSIKFNRFVGIIGLTVVIVFAVIAVIKVLQS